MFLVVHWGEIDSRNLMFLVMINAPLQSTGEWHAVSDFAMAALQTANDGDLIIKSDTVFALKIQRRRIANCATMVTASFMLGIVIAIHRVIPYARFRISVDHHLPLRHLRFASVVKQSKGLTTTKTQHISKLSPCLRDARVLESG